MTIKHTNAKYPGIIFISKSESKFMRLINFISYPFMLGKFNTQFFTTIKNTIYYPVVVEDLFSQQYEDTIEHELVHVEQFKKMGVILFFLFYIFLPLPILFSGRWFLERKAYMVQINTQKKQEHKENMISLVVDSLWKNYFFPYPRSLMTKWFKKQIKK